MCKCISVCMCVSSRGWAPGCQSNGGCMQQGQTMAALLSILCALGQPATSHQAPNNGPGHTQPQPELPDTSTGLDVWRLSLSLSLILSLSLSLSLCVSLSLSHSSPPSPFLTFSPLSFCLPVFFPFLFLFLSLLLFSIFSSLPLSPPHSLFVYLSVSPSSSSDFFSEFDNWWCSLHVSFLSFG